MEGSAEARPWILHVDLDQFLAAVEVRRRPELRGLPVVVGGDGNPRRRRQVVATASYEARAFGVRSGMPLSLALRACPQAVFLPHDRPVYEEASAEVMSVLRSFPVDVEEIGWDEAFVGATTSDPEALARSLRDAVLERTGLSSAVGIGETKLQAKTATGFAKPAGIARLTRSEWFAVMGGRPVTAIWGIGGRTADRLHEHGIHTVLELARTDHELLAQWFGPRIGPWLRMLAVGGDPSPVEPAPRVPVGRSREETFERDLVDRSDVDHALERLTRELVASLAPEGRRATHVAVKVRTAAFATRTRSAKLREPTLDLGVLLEAARVVLDRFDLQRPVRLLGVRLVLEPLPD